MRVTFRGSFVLVLVSLFLAALPTLADELRDTKKQYRELIGNGQFEDALAVARRALELAEAKKGAESPDAAKVLADIADIYLRMERYEDARAEIARALAVMEASRGPDSPRLAPLLLRAGNIEMRAGEAEAAVPLFARALQIREMKHGPKHKLLVLSLINLGNAYHAATRFDEALAAIERALAIQEKTGKIDLEQTEPIFMKIVARYYNRGKFDDARRLHESFLRIVELDVGVESGFAKSVRAWIDFLYDRFPIEGDERFEFVRYPSRESPIFFDLPNFDDTVVLTVWKRVVNGAFDHGFYQSASARAEVELGQGKDQAVLSTKSRIRPDEAVNNTLTLALDEVVWGEVGEAENPVGTMDYQRFDYRNEQCFAFARPFAPARKQLGQTKLLSGFYCHRRGTPLSDQDIAYVLSRLGMRNYAEPEPR